MRNSTAQVILLLALALLTQSARGQSEKSKEEGPKPDFSGTWLRDNAKSSGLQGAIASAELTLLIAHKDPEFRVARSIKLNEQQMTQEVVYYTDHRGETNPAIFGGGDLKSKTKWSKNKIETHASWARTSRSGDVSNFDSTEKWELAADGKTLIETVDISSPMGMRTLKQVFNRK